jgi:electron transport complex protein RnfA
MDTVSILLGTVFVHNLVLDRMLGILPMVGVSRKLETATDTAVVVAAVLLVTTPLVFLLQSWLLEPLNLAHLAPAIAFVMVLTCIQVAEGLLQRRLPALHKRYAVYVPLIRMNSAILGAGLFAAQSVESLWLAVVYGLGSGLGFAAITVLTGAMRERLATLDAPHAFRGIPLVLLSLALMAIGLLGLTSPHY